MVAKSIFATQLPLAKRFTTLFRPPYPFSLIAEFQLMIRNDPQSGSSFANYTIYDRVFPVAGQAKKPQILDHKGVLENMPNKPLKRQVRTSYQRIVNPTFLTPPLFLLSILLSINLLQPLSAGISGPQSAPQPVRYIIIVTGGELLSGTYPDEHTCFITRTLRPLGLTCVGSMCIDDKKPDLKDAIRFAANRASLIIVTGGLGPTDNDITREALSEFTGIPVKEHADVLQELARRFNVPPDQLRLNLRRQTQVPTQGAYFKNPNGTAVGLVFEMADSTILALPGPPRELQPMVRDQLVPYLKQRFGTRLPGCSLTLRFVGLGQSQIDQTLKDKVPLKPDITVSSQFQGGRVDFTFSLPDDTPQERTRLQELKQKIIKHLGDYVYAEDKMSLEEHVLKLLEKRGATLALAEVGSGGSLAAALNSADTARRVFAGGYVAPSVDKLRDLLHVSDDRWSNTTSYSQKIEQLAKAAADATKSQWAIAVGEVRTDRNGANYVDVAFKSPDSRLESQQIRLSGTGELARSGLTTQLLDQLRRRLK
jgi:nicotinamide-nucleotide amidase